MAVVNLSKDNFDSVVENNEIVLIDFWAQWCHPCISFADIYEGCANKYPEIVFAKVNVDDEPELSGDFNVRSVPLLMVLRQHVAVFAESGTMPEKALIDLIEQAKQLDMTKVHEQIKQQQAGMEGDGAA